MNNSLTYPLRTEKMLQRKIILLNFPLHITRHFATEPKKDASNAAYCAGSVKFVNNEFFLLKF